MSENLEDYNLKVMTLPGARECRAWIIPDRTGRALQITMKDTRSGEYIGGGLSVEDARELRDYLATYIGDTDQHNAFLATLREENARLRAALEYIERLSDVHCDDPKHQPVITAIGMTARQALAS